MLTARDEAKAKAQTGGWGKWAGVSNGREEKVAPPIITRPPSPPKYQYHPSRPNGNRAVPGSLVAAPGVTYDQENGPEPQSSRLSLSLILPLLHSLIRLENAIFQAHAGRWEDSTGTLPAWQPIQRPTACSRSEEDGGGPADWGDGRWASGSGEGGYGTRSASSTPI
ncbi:hypothetical protein CH63R_09402 [Colletotrichum higginsianum IMI 349063]|uniref:Uncharacterized protein n=1 Tax=Colletotrichum higginsianum (strain IMI 349063) TaxID=759273 RepID=A0A1B7Y756_COLHI|nr:hypothetical protein CH63R_09402 [Colletotrichum higginsianum IMI 349063]OBR07881.1 hypothetical protein CH63R_09402 [Colletotrichum higginsianum IMI 349063]